MGNSEKIFLPSMCEGAGAVYEQGNPDEKRDGVVWFLRTPGVPVVVDGVPIHFMPHISGVN